MDNFQYWMNRYLENRKGRPETFEYKYEASDYELFPRYNALGAILQGVEELIPSEYDSLTLLKEELIRVGGTYESIFTKDNHGAEKNAIDEERKKFIEFINIQSEETLENIPELFHRRKLKAKETAEYSARLQRQLKINVGQFWWPINEIRTNPSDFIILNDDDITDKQESKVNDLIQSISEECYFNLNEDGIDYELEKSCLNIFENSGEAFFFDESMNWLIYFSHEDFLIFWGYPLLGKFNNEFPEWKAKMNNFLKNVT